MKKLISANAPSLWSFKVISIWLLFWATMAFIFAHSKWLPISFGCIGAIGAWLMNTGHGSKRLQELQHVILEDGCFYIWESRIRRYPFFISDIDSIKKRRFLWLRIIEINLKKDTPLGRTIRFIPAKLVFPKGNGCDFLEELSRLASA